MLHKIYGTVIESSIQLPELLLTDKTKPEFNFELLSPREQNSILVPWFHQWGPTEEEVWLYFGKLGDRYLLRFPDLADFYISGTGENVQCTPVPEVPLETIRHLFLDQVFPLALSKRGKLVLHASSVVSETGAIAFIGKTGAGKSTLAASFAKDGFPFITDDCLVLEESKGELLAFPGYPGLRLWKEIVDSLFNREPEYCDVAHYTRKKRIDLIDHSLLFQDDPVILRRIYFLNTSKPSEDNGPISIIPISPRESFLELVRYAYKLDIGDRDMLSTEFSCLSRVVNLPIFYQLSYPHDLSLLPAVKEAILENLSSEVKFKKALHCRL